MNIIIIANGSFPTEEAVLAQLREADHLVCCDGALGKFLNWYRALSHRPLLRVSVVGDGDSLTSTVLEEARHEGLQLCHQLISEQESNDLSKAVRYALTDVREETSVHLSIVGATGLREDHTLGNISLLAYYAMEYPQVESRWWAIMVSSSPSVASAVSRRIGGSRSPSSRSPPTSLSASAACATPSKAGASAGGGKERSTKP